MKRIILFFVLFVAVFAKAQNENDLPNPSSPPRLVNDFTGNFLTQEQNEALEQKLVAYDDSTSSQIAIVIVNDLKGYSPADYAIALGRKWGVGGQKQFSNGVVILVKPKQENSKGEVFIATGYGLEGAVTDLIADQIIQNTIIPNFKAGNNYRALDDATSEIIEAAEGKYKAPDNYHDGDGDGGGLFGFLFMAFIIFIIIITIIKKNGGGGGGGYVSRRGYRDGWNGPIIFPGGWSGGGGGGGGWSGGGGGFGGFGGGSFGGGGAGGSW